MIKLKDLLLEEDYSTYTGMIRVTFDQSSMTASDAIDTIRAVEGVTTARAIETEITSNNIVTLGIKVRTLSPGQKAFELVRKQALAKPGIQKVELGLKTIEIV